MTSKRTSNVPPPPVGGKNREPSSFARRFYEGLPPRVAAFLKTQGVEGLEGLLPTPAAAAPPKLPQAVRGSARAARPLEVPPERAEPRRPIVPAAAPHGPKLSRLERARKARAAVDRREAMYLQRLTTKLREQGHHAVGIRPAPLRVWVGSGQAMGDPTGKAIRIHLRQLSNRAAAGMILKAALAGGRSWTSLRARRIATWGLGLVWLAHRTHRRDRWGALVKGFPREFWAALLRDPNDTRRAPYTRKSCPGNERDEKYRDQHSCTMCRAPGIPATSSLFGVHRFGAAPHSGDVGYLAPLREVGLVYSQQLPAKEVEAWEVGPKGHALNRYWVVTDCPGSIPDDDTRAAAWGFVELARLDVLELVRQLKRAAGPPAPPD